jgi:hypothetical protein
MSALEDSSNARCDADTIAPRMHMTRAKRPHERSGSPPDHHNARLRTISYRPGASASIWPSTGGGRHPSGSRKCPTMFGGTATRTTALESFTVQPPSISPRTVLNLAQPVDPRKQDGCDECVAIAGRELPDPRAVAEEIRSHSTEGVVVERVHSTIREARTRSP